MVDVGVMALVDYIVWGLVLIIVAHFLLSSSRFNHRGEGRIEVRK